MGEPYLIYPRLSWQLHSPVRYHGDASPYPARCVLAIHLLPACRLVRFLSTHPPPPLLPFPPLQFYSLVLIIFLIFSHFGVLWFIIYVILNFDVIYVGLYVLLLSLYFNCIIVLLCMCVYDMFVTGGGTGGGVFWPLPPIM